MSIKKWFTFTRIKIINVHPMFALKWQPLIGVNTPRGWTLHSMYKLTWVYEGVLFEALAYILYVREEYSFSLKCTCKKVIFVEVKVCVQNGALIFREKMLINVLVSSNLRFFIPLLSYGNCPQWPSCMLLWGIGLDSKFLQTIGSWSTHGLPWLMLSNVWLSYYALVFVCLIYSSRLMLWIKWLFHWKVKGDFMCNKDF